MLKGDSNKTYYQVMEYLTEQIRMKKLKKGDKMPTERELAEYLGVSRAAIRESYKILSIVGLLRSAPSQGTFIKDEFDDWFMEPMSIIFKLSDTTMKDVLEFRKMIEVEVATLAAEKITDGEIEVLTECYERMIGDDDEMVRAEYDKKFHGTIVKAAKNQIILNAYNAMSPMLQIFTRDIRSVVVDSEYEGILEELHRNIYEAIVSRDVEAARKSMQVHMETIIKYYK
ncbi:GntR family transcriptional regulator, transcriptional repressor for pyruvate dehydrogenase complex [Dethiosulfatibacter aminovorans DSM 17477]|uniref:GntR family transcriptional regulator, transcriptional repressor for pyruvate dehydrogenase complex n=1 Tax=Dethiosulfatibacter aminovorans DSM 17477 TaxID=1121476 RepID=A0A1M6BR94_9FIRM|nr:FadR/GntR family transcriptional regulator [Dethiosulfatibacter aminovorans]SHI51285.1 GntR family transcriptional regulator, transcriptional repressor for pyruvate dehydrogenase complex [Dethiosulfatibacter aminovorans DSM 17477]